MSISQTLYQLQILDSDLDHARKRIAEIDTILKDKGAQSEAEKKYQGFRAVVEQKRKQLELAENQVIEQTKKIEQNQAKLYGGRITNPKELEDLQLEFKALNNYLAVLEERQLEAMIETDRAEEDLNIAAAEVEAVTAQLETDHSSLTEEKIALEEKIASLQSKKQAFLSSREIPDLEIYKKLRASLGGIAVTVMVSSSCSSCGASIPSAVEQEARSPEKLAFCPTCKRILHPG